MRTNKDPFSLNAGRLHLDFFQSAHGSYDYLIHFRRLMVPDLTDLKILKVPTAMARPKELDLVTGHLDGRDRCRGNLNSSG